MCYNMNMKNITIRDDVYKKLLELKGEDMSFSYVIMELIEKRISIKRFKGILKDSEFLDEILREHLNERRMIKP